MRGNISIVKFLLVLVVGTVLGGVVLGVIGFLLAGREGFINMGIWGLALGFLGGISEGFAMLMGTHIWTGYAQRWGEASFKKISEGEDDKPNY